MQTVLASVRICMDIIVPFIILLVVAAATVAVCLHTCYLLICLAGVSVSLFTVAA